VVVAVLIALVAGRNSSATGWLPASTIAEGLSIDE
jgi:hypothetical protein